MERIDRILGHEAFKSNIELIKTAEADRCFCLHNMAHFLDVARIAQIINLQEEMRIDEELIYAAGLLHDIGKHMQYSDGIPHEVASAELAIPILADCGFDENEIDIITDAIKKHRDATIAVNRDLSGILYRADKASRACFACDSQKDCNWTDSKKNLKIKY